MIKVEESEHPINTHPPCGNFTIIEESNLFHQEPQTWLAASARVAEPAPVNTGMNMSNQRFLQRFQYLLNCFNHQIKRFFAQEHTQHHLSESRQVHSTVRLALGISPQLLYLRNIPCHMPWPWHRLTIHCHKICRRDGHSQPKSEMSSCFIIVWKFIVSWNGGTHRSYIYRLIFIDFPLTKAIQLLGYPDLWKPFLALPLSAQQLASCSGVPFQHVVDWNIWAPKTYISHYHNLYYLPTGFLMHYS